MVSQHACDGDIPDCKMSEDFRKLCKNVRRKFNSNTGVWLSPKDLGKMAANQVVLAPATENPSNPQFYESVLLCKVCDFRADTIDMISRHCMTSWHHQHLCRWEVNSSTQRRKIIEEEELTSAEDEKPTQGPPQIDRLRIMDRDVIAAITNRSDGLSYSRVLENFKSCKSVNYFTCELCQIWICHLEAFLLHITGFGHQQRRIRLTHEGVDYFQAFLTPYTGEMYFLNLKENTLGDNLEPERNLMFGYSTVSGLSLVPRDTLAQIIRIAEK